MKYSIIVFALLFLFVFSFPVLASDVAGTVAVDAVAEPDTSAPEQVSLEDINNSLGIIQSQLWIFLVVGLLGYIYKFFRLFF